MPLDNLNSNHPTEQEKDTLNDLVSQIEQLLEDKLINLTPVERRRYGSVDEQNKLIINKVRYFAQTDASLRSPDVKWEEFERDYVSRQFWEGYMLRFNSLITGIKNAKILHDYDNYQDAMRDYRYSKYKNGIEPGYEHKVTELKQFFRGGRPPTPKASIEPQSNEQL